MRRSLARVALLVVLVPVLSGCYHATINTGARPSMETIEQPWAMSFVYGLIPPPVVETAARCPTGVAMVETQHSFLNMIVQGITFGIVTPMTIKVTCAAARMEEDADASTLSLDRNAAIDVNRQAVADALEQLGGAPLLVSFE